MMRPRATNTAVKRAQASGELRTQGACANTGSITSTDATAGADSFQLTARALSCGAELRTGAAPNNGCVNKRK